MLTFVFAPESVGASDLSHATGGGPIVSLGNAAEIFLPYAKAKGGASQIDSIVEKASQSGECREVGTRKNHEALPVDFLKGMGYSLVRSLCGRGQNPVVGFIKGRASSVKGLLTAPPGVYSKNDVLLSPHYRPSSSKEKSGNAAATYAILAALAMRESDANILEGAYRPGSHTSTATLEAGAYQVSADSQALLDRGSYKELLSSYVGALKAAGSDASRVEDICRISKYTGTTPKHGKQKINASAIIRRVQLAVMNVSEYNARLSDRNFQEINKSCPAFATEYAALVARANMNHNGPLKRGIARPSAGCSTMFDKVSVLAEQSEVCSEVKLSSAPRPVVMASEDK